jgi:glycosyltransferase involved in cell wall biosynthesis
MRAVRQSAAPSATAGTASVVICNWRDLRHPEAGGSERFVESVASELAAMGNTVTILCAAVRGAPRNEVRAAQHNEVRGAVRYRRRGGRITVYLHAAWALLARRVVADVVIDVQNGIPFLSPLVTRRPVVALVHHVHREQWPLLFGRVAARVGWWVESHLAPVLYRRSRYVVVSEATRRELIDLGVHPSRVDVVHNGTPALPAPKLARSPVPRVVVLGRLVPHKRVEIVVTAAALLRDRYPGLLVDVVGRGYHEAALRAHADRLGLAEQIRFRGWVSEQTKADLLAQAWVNAVPSVKEGWALSIVEAASVATPSVAFAGAGGVEESVVDGVTGVIVAGGTPEFADALDALLADNDRRGSLGLAARARAAAFTWEQAGRQVATILDGELSPVTVPGSLDAVPIDPVPMDRVPMDSGRINTVPVSPAA